MSEVLYDVNLAETKLLRKNISIPAQELQRKADLSFILKKHEVSDSLFKQSYAFYSTHPVWMKKVLESTIEKVDVQSTELDK